MKTIIAGFALALAALAAVHGTGADAPHGAQADPSKYLCVFPKSISAEHHTATTPTVCVPSP